MNSALVLAAALACLLLEPAVHASVHRFSPRVKRQPVSTAEHQNGLTSSHSTSALDRVLSRHHSVDWAVAQYRMQLLRQRAEAESSSGSSGGRASIFGARYTENFLVDVDIGTPAQGPFEVLLDFGYNQLYVLKTGAMWAGDGDPVTKTFPHIHEFNRSASITAKKVKHAHFTPQGVFNTGKVVADTVGMGSLAANLSVQVTKNVTYTFSTYGAEGILGLGISANRTGASLVEQLAASEQLSSPIVTLFLNTSTFEEDANETNSVLSFGDRVPEICDAATWMAMHSAESQFDSYPWMDIVSVEGPASSNCSLNTSVTANITVGVYFAASDGITAIFGESFILASYQVMKVIGLASGGKWNPTNEWYMVDDVSAAKSVNLTGADGSVFELTPNDYLRKNRDGDYYTAVYSWYDEDEYAQGFILFNQHTLNNHCLSMHMQSGEWSIAGVLQPEEAEQAASSSSSSSSSSD